MPGAVIKPLPKKKELKDSIVASAQIRIYFEDVCISCSFIFQKDFVFITDLGFNEKRLLLLSFYISGQRLWNKKQSKAS